MGARGQRATLRVVAQHADVWHIPGFPTGIVDDFRLLSGTLDDHCRMIGRDPSTNVRSVQVLVDMNDPATMVETICALSAAGAGHIVLNLMPPYDQVLRNGSLGP